MNITSAIIALIFVSSSTSFLFKVIGGEGTLGSLVLLKDIAMVALVVLAVKTVIKRKTFRFGYWYLELLLVGYILLCTIYCLRSPIPINETLKQAWSLVFGPLLYLCLVQINPNSNTINKILRFMYRWLTFLVVSGIIIYLVGQEDFFKRIGLLDFLVKSSDDDAMLLVNFFRTNKEGLSIARMTGLLVSNLDMAFVLIIYSGLIYIFERTNYARLFFWFIWGIALWLSTSRSAAVGIIIAIFVLLWIKQRIWIKAVSLILALGVVLQMIFYALNNPALVASLDSSSVAHFYHLFISGPELVLANLKGAGIGMATTKLVGKVFDSNFVGNIESFYYMLSIEIGVAGLLLYLTIVRLVLKRIIHQRDNEPHSYHTLYNGLFVIILSIHIGAVFLPVLDSRTISSLLWTLMYIGVNLSYVVRRHRLSQLPVTSFPAKPQAAPL